MSDPSDVGVLYTDHADLRRSTTVASLWSYQSQARERHRRPVAVNADGNLEYWLNRSDPLLNTILPGTAVSFIVNFGDLWAAGRSLATSALLPRLCVIGPFTESRILRVGRCVRAVGAVTPTTVTSDVLGVPPAELVNQIVPLDDLWPRDDVDRFFETLSCLDVRACLVALKQHLVARIGGRSSRETVAQAALRLISRHGGRVSIDHVAKSHGLSRQRLAREFSGATGLPPKLFARITRFQALVHALLSADVSQWVSVSPDVGFYDQAHMINEFRAFAGSPPTVFFQPHGVDADSGHVRLHGRPSEWLRRPPAS